MLTPAIPQPPAQFAVMDEPLTAGELWARHDDLEVGAATALGRLLMAFARLDMSLGLCLVWIDGGAQLATLTPKVEQMTFNNRLDMLASVVVEKFVAGTRKRSGYELWIAQTHAIRMLRNELAHGRWGVDPRTNEAVNIIGLPTSPDQREVRHSIEALNNAVAEIQRLTSRLSQLREQWPLD